MKLIALLAFSLTVHATEKHSCMEVACNNGLCKWSLTNLSKACANANDGCVRAACKANSTNCKWETSLIKIANDCAIKK